MSVKAIHSITNPPNLQMQIFFFPMQVENVHSVDMRAYCWRKRVQGLKNHVEPDLTSLYFPK